MLNNKVDFYSVFTAIAHKYTHARRFYGHNSGVPEGVACRSKDKYKLSRLLYCLFLAYMGILNLERHNGVTCATNSFNMLIRICCVCLFARGLYLNLLLPYTELMSMYFIYAIC